jgi:XRE family transcriptional regulator, regulator of sulfur utilization
MFTRRELTLMTATAAVTFAVAAGGYAWAADAASAPPGSVAALGSVVFDWSAKDDKPTEVGKFRQIARSKTATLDELEMHVTTLQPGKASHPPHRHPNEELVILKEGTLEAVVDGKTQRVNAGSIIFNASNQLHGVKNVGQGPAVYYVINWSPPGSKKTTAAVAPAAPAPAAAAK